MQNNDKFGWKNYGLSIILMIAWLIMLGYVSVTSDALYVVVPLYFFTLYVSYRLKKKIPIVLLFLAIFLTTLVMLVVLVDSQAYLPWYKLSSNYPIFIRFLYFLYPPVVGALSVTLVFFYPLNKLFKEKSRFCLWGLTIFLYLKSGEYLWVSYIPPLYKLINATTIFSPILVWFFVAQISKMYRMKIFSSQIANKNPIH